MTALRIAHFGMMEKEHFRECVEAGLMTEEERKKETERLSELVSKAMERVLSHPEKKCVR